MPLEPLRQCWRRRLLATLHRKETRVRGLLDGFVWIVELGDLKARLNDADQPTAA